MYSQETLAIGRCLYMKVQRKPIQRSKLRLFMGRNYYTIKKYLSWYITNKKYAKGFMKKELEYEITTHKTPLIRKLKDVDMYLQYNKITNLRLASDKLNGIVVRPGETFSYWKLIGKPTYKKGYLDGLVLCADGNFKPGVGGGLCQLSNLIYWLTLHTPLSVVERYRHSHDIFPDSNRTQPFGSGATCVYNYFDLQIYNGTKDEFQLIVFLEDDYLCGQWRSNNVSQYRYEVYEKDHLIEPSFWGGYIRNNSIYRKVFNMENEIIKDEFITENHAIMTYQPYLEAKNS